MLKVLRLDLPTLMRLPGAALRDLAADVPADHDGDRWHENVARLLARR